MSITTDDISDIVVYSTCNMMGITSYIATIIATSYTNFKSSISSYVAISQPAITEWNHECLNEETNFSGVEFMDHNSERELRNKVF